ncbi:MAG: sugar ABC transporter ATP-binding protein [Sphaerochaetaceae bacterium]
MIIETKHLSKRFGNFYALEDINFAVQEGEIHGLVGENGAGKSTLIKILTGVYHLTNGEIFVSGEKANIQTPSDSRRLGISVIHQDRNIVPAFNGVENVYLGLDVLKRHITSVDFATMKANVQKVMVQYQIDIPLDKMARDLTPPQKTMLEIVRAVMTNCKLLILDEPTASLTDKESELLFALIKKLNAKGTAILYVSHRLEEIFQLTNRITVFKNGKLVKTVETKGIDSDGLIRLMTDNWTSTNERHGQEIKGEPIYSIEHVSSADGMAKDVSFASHAGEIMGLFGLGGSGRTETLEAIYGYKPLKSGKIFFKGKEIKNPTPSKSIQSGIVLIHEDRRGHSLVMSREIKDNVVLSTIDSYVEKGFFNATKERDNVNTKIKELEIKTTGPEQRTSELSGGNQQKVVFARALMSVPKVFLCDEPTQAVDVMTRKEIHNLLRKCADKGSAVVYVTSDLKEMLEVADTITIIANGKTWERLENRGLTSKQVLSYCYQKR